MAPRLRVILFSTAILIASVSLPKLEPAAFAAGLDARGEADAMEATTLYKQGRYEEAARIFAKLSVHYPDMLIFERNVGACFYYLKKPEPALSNLRNYLNYKRDIEPDDKAVVDRWIDEMEKLRAQGTAAAPPVAAPLAGPALPVAAPIAGGAVSASAAAPSDGPALPAPSQSSEVAPASAVAPAALAHGPAGAGSPADATKQAAGVDLAAALPGTSGPITRPFYKTWWFWTGVGAVVLAGTVTTILLAGRSSSPCDGASLACMGVK